MQKTIHSKKYRVLIDKLRAARKEAGLTQLQVAKKLKKTQSYISKVEVGEQRIDVIELKMFADLYKKDLNDFIK
jgi:transcriptional regulator with XRE-family HTH domain